MAYHCKHMTVTFLLSAMLLACHADCFTAHLTGALDLQFKSTQELIAAETLVWLTGPRMSCACSATAFIGSGSYLCFLRFGAAVLNLLLSSSVSAWRLLLDPSKVPSTCIPGSDGFMARCSFACCLSGLC